MEHMDINIILNMLAESIFSENIIFHERIESTNSLAKELAVKGEKEGTLVLAEEQTGGRGRMDRRWLSPPYKNLLFSIILRPDLPVDSVFSLTMILSVATIEAIKKTAGLSLMIKWPNDIYLNNMKLGGILTEFSVKGERPEYVVLGLGLNVNWTPESSADMLFSSTSILKETGKSTVRERLLADILKGFEAYYREVVSCRMDSLKKKWNDLSLVTGREVAVSGYNEKTEGIAQGIDDQGALLIRRADGSEQRIMSGDVSLRF